MYIDSTLIPEAKQGRGKVQELTLSSNCMIVLTVLLAFQNLKESSKMRRCRVTAEDISKA